MTTNDKTAETIPDETTTFKQRLNNNYGNDCGIK